MNSQGPQSGWVKRDQEGWQVLGSRPLPARRWLGLKDSLVTEDPGAL